MKIPSAQSQRGSVLVTALVFGVIGGFMLGGYLMLIQTRSVQTHRSLAWNSALTVVEAGIEEAFTHLQVDANSPTNNNWTAGQVNGQTVYWKRRDLPDGSYFYVTNSGVSSGQPVIQSRGFVRAPLRSNEYISRLVRVTLTRPSSSFNKAIVVNTSISFGGSATIVDSFNSNIAPYTNTVHGTNGGLATNSKQSGALDVQSADVYGTVTTGPGGVVATGSSGTVGDVAWNATQTGIEPGWVADDMNISFLNNSLPPGVTWFPTTIKGPTALNTGYYTLTKTSMSGSDTLTITGKVVLYLTDDFNMTGNAFIRVSSGSSLTIYGGASTVKFAGQGIINDTGVAANVTYLGLPTNTKVDYSGGSAFIGTINAPQAAVSTSGNSGFYGAVIANSFNATGGSNFHYDEALGVTGTTGNATPLLTSYLEL